MSQSINNNKYSISKLDKTHQRQKFSCGIELLDDYLHKRAGQDYRRHVSITYILYDIEQNHVAGYYTLSSTSIELMDVSDKLKSKLPQYPLLPATLIGRLAVDLNYQKQTLGEILLIDALKRAYQHTNEIASFAVIVDAINDNAIKFYEKYAFVPVQSNKSKLYLPMESIGKLLS
jgi:ribosomal protein S18 acetylase RimI-like enzyme